MYFAGSANPFSPGIDLVAEHKAENAQSAVQRIEERLEKLTLINMALWSLLKEKTGLTDEQLNERVHEIDMADGRLDGRPPIGSTEMCPKCNQALSKKFHRCLLCGYEPPGGDVFSTVSR